MNVRKLIRHAGEEENKVNRYYQNGSPTQIHAAPVTNCRRQAGLAYRFALISAPQGFSSEEGLTLYNDDKGSADQRSSQRESHLSVNRSRSRSVTCQRRPNTDGLITAKKPQCRCAVRISSNTYDPAIRRSIASEPTSSPEQSIVGRMDPQPSSSEIAFILL